MTESSEKNENLDHLLKNMSLFFSLSDIQARTNHENATFVFYDSESEILEIDNEAVLSYKSDRYESGSFVYFKGNDAFLFFRLSSSNNQDIINKILEGTLSFNINGKLDGVISHVSRDHYEIVIASVRDICDKSKITELRSNHDLLTIIKKNFIICELTQLAEETKAEFKANPDIVFNSISAFLSFKMGIYLENPRDKYYMRNKVDCASSDGTPNINITLIRNADILRFFLSAEKSEYLHFAYLDYYHILEYYYDTMAFNKLKTEIDNLVVSKLRNGKYDDAKLVLLQDNYESFLNKKANEIDKLKLLLSEKISTDDLLEIMNTVTQDKIFLSTFNEIPKTEINSKFYDKKKYCTASDCSLTDAISSRIYAIRNAIVHSSDKGKKQFNYNPSIYEKFELEVELIRKIAFHVAVVFALENR